MEITQLFGQLNWVDWIALLVILGHVLTGMRRGFVVGTLDLMGMVVALGAAIFCYRQAATLLLQVAPQVPRSIAFLGSFLALVVLAQLVYAAALRLLFHASRPLRPFLGPLALIDSMLGAAPGAVKGLVFATLLLLPFALFPIVPPASTALEQSAIASRLVVSAVSAAPGLESLLGRELNEGLSFLAPPQAEEGMKMNFGVLGQLTPDPAAEERMLSLLNAEREKVGLKPLEMDEKLRQVARNHSQEMFKLSYFAHQSPVTGSPFDRMRQGGITFQVAGENLAYAPNVQIAHEGLMNSPGHKANILRNEFGKVGIGVIKSDFRGSMFSQEFTN